MYWGRPVKIDTALYPISTQRNLAVAPDDISMPLNPDFYGSRVMFFFFCAWRTPGVRRVCAGCAGGEPGVHQAWRRWL
jgi:hypothetical protein